MSCKRLIFLLTGNSIQIRHHFFLIHSLTFSVPNFKNEQELTFFSFSKILKKKKNYNFLSLHWFLSYESAILNRSTQCLPYKMTFDGPPLFFFFSSFNSPSTHTSTLTYGCCHFLLGTGFLKAGHLLPHVPGEHPGPGVHLTPGMVHGST